MHLFTSSSRLSTFSCNFSFSSKVLFKASRLFSATAFQYWALGSPSVVKSSTIKSNWDFSPLSWFDLRRLGSASFCAVTTAVSLNQFNYIHKQIYYKWSNKIKRTKWKQREHSVVTYDLDFLYNDFSPDVITLRPTKFSLSDASFCKTFNVLRMFLIFSWRKHRKIIVN